MKKIVSIDIDRKQRILMISDIHIDHPDCDRKLLKSHLDEALATNALIMINGDLFDVMQGKNDKRSSKKSLKKEFMVEDYFGAVVRDAVDFFAPYAKNLVFVGYGNHETSIMKHNEIDILSQFVTIMQYKHNSPVQLGEYTGFINLRVSFVAKKSSVTYTYVIYYHHGYGGGGVVTKGVIQNQRKDAQIEGVDCVWMGHVHELYHIITIKDVYDRGCNKIKQRTVNHIRTSTYKREDKGSGWHEERGAPAKPLGGYWLSIASKVNDNGTRYLVSNYSMAT
jgi:UDP-2,3-diacylglucosamine pyrophosphatase LpxH